MKITFLVIVLAVVTLSVVNASPLKQEISDEAVLQALAIQHLAQQQGIFSSIGRAFKTYGPKVLKGAVKVLPHLIGGGDDDGDGDNREAALQALAMAQAKYRAQQEGFLDVLKTVGGTVGTILGR